MASIEKKQAFAISTLQQPLALTSNFVWGKEEEKERKRERKKKREREKERKKERRRKGEDWPTV